MSFVSYTTRYPSFDFEQFLQERHLEYKQYDAEDHKEWAINCPECQNRGEPTPDEHHKLWINLIDARFICYRCEWAGSFTKLIQKLANTTFEGALQILRGTLLDPLDHMNLKLFDEKIDLDDSEKELREIDLPYGYEPIEGPHDYLDEREIPWRYAADHDWGFSKIGYVKDRIIVPTFMDYRLVFWQARATWPLISKEELKKKVLNPKGISARSVLYNYDEAKEFDEIILCEGFIDAVKCGPNAVATNGKNLHPGQVEWLTKTKAKTIILAWDADAWNDQRKGKRGLVKASSIERAVDLLRVYYNVKCAVFEKGIDAGSFPFKSTELEGILKNAKEYNKLKGSI